MTSTSRTPGVAVLDAPARSVSWRGGIYPTEYLWMLQLRDAGLVVVNADVDGGKDDDRR